MSDFFQGLAARQMPISVVDLFEMINVHHQNAKLSFFAVGARRFATKLGKKRAARKQSGQIVVRKQPPNLMLILAINFIQQFKSQNMLANRDFIAAPQNFRSDLLPVQKSSVFGV